MIWVENKITVRMQCLLTFGKFFPLIVIYSFGEKIYVTTFYGKIIHGKILKSDIVLKIR